MCLCKISVYWYALFTDYIHGADSPFCPEDLHILSVTHRDTSIHTRQRLSPPSATWQTKLCPPRFVWFKRRNCPLCNDKIWYCIFFVVTRCAVPLYTREGNVECFGHSVDIIGERSRVPFPLLGRRHSQGKGEGMKEEWIAYVLKQTLQGLKYFHDQGQVGNRVSASADCPLHEVLTLITCDGAAHFISGVRSFRRNCRSL